MKSLPVLKSSAAKSPEQMVRLYHQAHLDWCRHLGEETELDFGRWIHNADLPLSDDANCLLDAFVYPGLSASDVIRDAKWQTCTLNPSMSAERIDPLKDVLLETGWTAYPRDIFYRGRPTVAAYPIINDLTIIPARASYRHYRQLMDERSSDQTEAAMLHLDDSHFDVLLALKNGNPVGSIGILGSGEVGTVREWFVSPSHRRKGIGRTLLDRAMEICIRGQLSHVMIAFPAPGQSDRDKWAIHLCQTCGFTKIGHQLTFHKNSCKSGRLFA